jgi:hypothetical protein
MIVPALALAALLVGPASAERPPRLFELTTGGTVHDIPVESFAIIYSDQTWEMECRSRDPQRRPALTFAIEGHVEFLPKTDPPRLHFTSDYARAVVDLVLDCSPDGRGIYADRETAGTALADIRIDPEAGQRWRRIAAAGGALSPLEKALARCVR